MKAKVIVLLTVMALCANECSSSAIPMWEYLSRDEKVSTFHWSGGMSAAGNRKAILCFIKINISEVRCSGKFFFGFYIFARTPKTATEKSWNKFIKSRKLNLASSATERRRWWISLSCTLKPPRERRGKFGSAVVVKRGKRDFALKYSDFKWK